MLRIQDARNNVKRGIEQLEKLNLSDAKDFLLRAMTILNHPAFLSMEIDSDEFNRVVKANQEVKDDNA
jgi:hypothetical protein